MRKRVVLAGVGTVLVLVAVVGTRTAYVHAGLEGAHEVQAWRPVSSTPTDATTVYTATGDLAKGSDFGLSAPVLAPDGTIWLQQDARAGEYDNQHLHAWSDLGQELVALHPDGTARAEDTPYDGPGRGRTVVPLCAAPDGTIYASSRKGFVARDPRGRWRKVAFRPTAGAPQPGSPPLGFNVCAVEPDGAVLVGTQCAIERLTPDGALTVIAGRHVRDDLTGWGCGQADMLERTTGYDARQPLLRGAATASDIPQPSSLAIGPDGRVWVGSWYSVRTLTRQADGSYTIDTIATPDHSQTQGVTWSARDTSVFAKNVYDVQPLPDGRVLLVAGEQIWQIGRDGILRPGAAGRYRSLAAAGDRLYTVGPIGQMSAGALRVSRLP